MDSFIKSAKKLVNSYDCNCDNECNAKWFKRNFKNWTSASITLELINEIAVFYKAYEVYGITQDPETKNYMLSAHYYNVRNALEWIPYASITSEFINKIVPYKVYGITQDPETKNYMVVSDINKCGICYNTSSITLNPINKIAVSSKVYGITQDPETKNYMVVLKDVYLNNPASITSKYMDKIALSHKVYGITQDLETKKYMVVLKDICKKCNEACNSMRFQRNFENWTSGNNDIDKFIQDTQLSVHKDNEISHALEWIPYDRLYDVKYITDDYKFDKIYRANWFDGYISCWYSSYNGNQNWKREDQNMFIILKILDNPLKFMNKIAVPSKVYGITQDPETKNYMVVLENICEKYTQLTAHTYNEEQNALEWIPYDRFYDIKYIAKGGFGKVYKAKWDDHNQNWIRKDQNMVVALKSLNNSRNVALEFMNEITLHHKIMQKMEVCEII
ncbi:kinase-like domain-containing protein [Rhizophagus irregularis DAOM 181602=DAOM 197198]|nr:kinase-like domain-containing protein [Rhizophagus irregularis DAOM 181602=DAOM 197198]